MSEALTALVFAQVSACMESVVSSSGHLASIALVDFEVLSARDLGDGNTEYTFTGAGCVQTELSPEPYPPEGVRGTIVLNRDGQVLIDGPLARIAPYKCLAPPPGRQPAPWLSRLPIDEVKARLMSRFFPTLGHYPVELLLPEQLHHLANQADLDMKTRQLRSDWAPIEMGLDWVPDEEFFAAIAGPLAPDAEVIVVTDQAELDGYAHVLPVAELRRFTEDVYPHLQGYRFFKTLDTIVVQPAAGHLTALSFDGVAYHLEVP